MIKISVILPVYNAERTLFDAIESMRKQTFLDFECFVINDASTDKTGNILKKLSDKRFRIITNKKHRGLTASLNIGLKKASAPFIARMDADDIALPYRFAHQMEYLRKDKKLALVGSWVELIDRKRNKIGEHRYPVSYKEIRNVIMRYNPFIHPSIMVRRKVLQELGYYDEDLDGAEDYDLCLRIAKHYKVENIPQVLLRYRIQTESVSWHEMKKIEAAAIKARIKALTSYRYSLWQAIYLVKPLFSFLIPVRLKQSIIARTNSF